MEDNVLNIQQHQHETTLAEEMEALDPQPLWDEIWEALIPEGIKSPYLAKFDRCSDPYEDVASTTRRWSMAIIGVTP